MVSAFAVCLYQLRGHIQIVVTYDSAKLLNFFETLTIRREDIKI